jgi:asparagine synthase (glutamine-hydrolysing)
MSGGLDSTAVAATARKLLARQSASFELSACTLVYDRLFPDEERRYAEMTAQMLGIPIHCHVADDYLLYQQYRSPGMHFPEPVHDPDGAAGIDAMRVQAARGRVLLTGWDGDALLSESPKPYFRYLLKQGRMVRLLAGVAGYAHSERRLFPLKFRDWLANGRTGDIQDAPDYPQWLSPSLEERHALRARWAQVNAALPTSHPVRPYAYQSFEYIIQESNFFDCYDPGVTGLPLEARHPLLDVRLLEYCLTLPPQPWCVKKRILREAMRGLLPEPVRLRPKTPIAGWPGAYGLRAAEARLVDDFKPHPGLDDFVNRRKIPRIWGAGDTVAAWTNLRPLSLNFWLRHLEPTSRQRKGTIHEFA